MEIEQDKKAWIVGLSVACPHGQELGACPVRHIRDRTLKERVQMIHEMSQDCIDNHLRHHAKCSMVRSSDIT